MSDRTKQITVRLSERELKRLDAIAKQTALPGEGKNRSRAFRQWLHNQDVKEGVR